MKTALYTVLFDGYDNLAPINVQVPAIVFTDNPDLRVRGWITRYIEIPDVYKQREIKLLAHKYLPQFDRTIYIDANMQMRQRLDYVLSLHKVGITLSKHHSRKCVFDEAEACVSQGKITKSEANKQTKNYTANLGMWATGLLIRDNCKEVNDFCELWNDELQKHTHRDQLSIGYAKEKTGISFNEISYQEMARIVNIKKHNPPAQVYYFSGFRSDKNIGKANNDHIKKLPDNDWICLTDADSMFLLPNYGNQIEKIVKQHGKDYGLIGCMTNRLRGEHQLYKGKFSDDTDIRNHYEIAKELQAEKGTEVVPTSGVAGVFMLFNKAVWKQAGGFKENEICCDTYFNKAIRRCGYKIGLATGVYVFHSYRIWEKGKQKAANSIKHLL